MPLTREVLERWQVVVYVAAIAAGSGLGLRAPVLGSSLSVALWPALAALLFVTFLQVPLAHLGDALADRRALGALLVGNFVGVPMLVWGLSRFLPAEGGLALGFFLVMLVPCTDWFVTFTHLGRGDGTLALASTPILLVAQVVLLPGYLLLALGADVASAMRAEPFVQAFLGIILGPLLLAAIVARVAGASARGREWLTRSAKAPVPLLGVVLFVITASELHGVLGAAQGLGRVVSLFVAYLALAPLLGVAISRVLGLEVARTRTVLFSVGTRNSFVVLPLALAWPGAGVTVAAVVVVQSFVELCGMVVYVAVVPRLVRDR